jgi:signal transduction histidine kinase
LSQIVINLVNNAIKFTDQGGVQVSAQQQNGVTNILVTDSGVGIDPEDQTRLFDAFARLESASGNREGTGLGLHLSQKLAALLGGQITLESEPGRGSAFHLTIAGKENQA